MTAETRTDVGVSREMVEAFATGKAESLTVTLRKDDDPSVVLSAIAKLLVEFPNVGYMLGQDESDRTLFFYKNE